MAKKNEQKKKLTSEERLTKLSDFLDKLEPKPKVPKVSRAVAFGLLFGIIGAHNFYLKYTVKGMAQLLLFVLGIVLLNYYVGIFIVFGVYIWSFVETVMIICGCIDKDKDGVLLVPFTLKKKKTI